MMTLNSATATHLILKLMSVPIVGEPLSLDIAKKNSLFYVWNKVVQDLNLYCLYIHIYLIGMSKLTYPVTGCE